MAALAPMPSASERMATTVTKGVRKSVRNASFTFRMNHLVLGSRITGHGHSTAAGVRWFGPTTEQVAPGYTPVRPVRIALGGDGHPLARAFRPSERQAQRDLGAPKGGGVRDARVKHEVGTKG